MRIGTEFKSLDYEVCVIYQPFVPEMLPKAPLHIKRVQFQTPKGANIVRDNS